MTKFIKVNFQCCFDKMLSFIKSLSKIESFSYKYQNVFDIYKITFNWSKMEIFFV